MKKIKEYTLEEHRHRLAVWASSRAVSRGAGGLSVSLAKDILEASGFGRAFSIKDIPTAAADFDKEHEKWDNKVIKEAKKKGRELTYGVAAKLINCYLKVRFVACGCSGEDEVRVRFIHPPIDRLLLKELKRENVGNVNWKKIKGTWSKFEVDDYRKVIDMIKEAIPDKPLWKIEEYWPIHQKKRKKKIGVCP